MLHYQQTHLQEIHHASLKKAGVNLIIKREDLNHPHVSGNKWWKLKYNLLDAIQKDYKTILTFGGAFSNHLFAAAAASHEVGLKSIGIIRGEKTLPLNPTLQFALNHEMQIHYISREQYREKLKEEFIDNLHREFGAFYLIPEGGSNPLAVKGCAEFAETELSNINYDYLCLPVGTGGTMAGIICGLQDRKNIVGIAVLKNGGFLKEDIKKFSEDFSGKSFQNWSLLTHYHHGGYAKFTPELLAFIAEMKLLHNLPLDPVYTGKLLWAVMKEIEKGYFKRGSTILVLHTGGLQPP